MASGTRRSRPFSSRKRPHHFFDFVFVFFPVLGSLTKTGFLYRLAIFRFLVVQSTRTTVARFWPHLKAFLEETGQAMRTSRGSSPRRRLCHQRHLSHAERVGIRLHRAAPVHLARRMTKR